MTAPAQTKRDILLTNTFDEILKAWQGGKRRIFLEGGTWSSKTYSAMQFLVFLLSNWSEDEPLLATVSSESMPHLKRGAMLDFKNIMGDSLIEGQWNRSDFVYTFPKSRCKLEFVSDDHPEKFTGGRRDIHFWNELNNIHRLSYMEGDIRTRLFTIGDWNPYGEFWFHDDKLAEEEGNVYIHGLTYHDTPEVVSKKTIETIESYKDKDPNYYRVHALGLLGNLEGLVYPLFEQVDSLPEGDYFYGLDYGFACVDEETEILTQCGWKRQNELKQGERVLTLNATSGLSEWQTLQDIHRFKGKFDMRLIDGKSHNSLTTTNHRWLIEPRPKSGIKKRRFQTTAELGGADKIACARKCDNLPQVKTYSDAFVELVAWFYTEGQISAGGVEIYQNEGVEADNIRLCLTKVFGKPLTKTRNGRNRAKKGWAERPVRRINHCQFSINMNGADDLIKVAPNKVVKPEFISILTYEQLELFVDVSIRADGWSKDESRAISQSELERLNPIQMACSLLGIRTHQTEGKSNGFKHYRLFLYKNNDTTYIGELIKRRPSIQKVIYKGLIWCPQTHNGTWLARRRGTVYFTGNSDPTVFTKHVIVGDKLYSQEMFTNYNALTNDQIAREIDLCHVSRSSPIYPDPDEPKSAQELRDMGWTILDAVKGKGSVEYGIKKVNEYYQYWTKGSLNCIKAQRNFRYIEDKDHPGRFTNRTTHQWSHWMTPRRYAAASYVPPEHGAGSRPVDYLGGKKEKFRVLTHLG